MQKPILPKNWHLPGGILSLALVFAFGIPQTSLAIYAAIIAKQNITFSGNGSFVDSFDSTDPLESTNGQYDPANPGDNGLVSSATGSIFIGNADVYGYVWALSPALVSFEANGGVGTHSWLSTNWGVEPGHIENSPIFDFPTVTLPFTNGPAPGLGTLITTSTNVVSVTNSSTPPPLPAPSQTINCSTNLYITGTNTIVQVTGSNQVITLTSSNLVCGTIQFSGNTLPANWCSYTVVQHGGFKGYQWTLIVGTNVVYQTNTFYTYSTNYVYRFGTNYDYAIYTAILQTNYYDHILCGNYCAGNLSGVTLVTCPSTLVLTNGLQQMGIDSITIMPSASLLLYVDGGAVTIGSGGIANLSGSDTNLQIYCTPGVSYLGVDYTSPLSPSLLAVIVAPDTDVSINGYGIRPVEFSGSIMARSLTANAVLHMHGDEAVGWLTAPVVVVATVSPPALMPAQSNPIVAVGWGVTFHASYMGSGMSLQWFFNGTNLIANATNSSLSLSNVTTDMAGEYSLQVSGPGIFFVSEPAWLTVVPTPAATLDSCSISASNQFQFNVNGLPGYNYRVDGSSNLIDWTPLGGGLSPFSFTDTNQLGLQYFYRALYVPPQ